MPSPLVQIIGVVFALVLSVIGIILSSIAIQKYYTNKVTANPAAGTSSSVLNDGIVTQNVDGDSLFTTKTARSIIFAQRVIDQSQTSVAKPIPDEVGRFDSDGKFAVNVSGPQAWAHVQSADEKYPHLRLASDPHNYSDLTTNADGVLEIKTVAGAINVDNHYVESSVWPFVTEMDQSVGTEHEVEFKSVSLGNSSSRLGVDSAGGLSLKSAQSYILLNNVNVSNSALQNIRTMDQAVSTTSDVSFNSTTLGDPLSGHLITLTVNASNHLCLNGNPLSTSSTIANTDDIPEGKTNEYFTILRARNAFSSTTPITLIDGVIGLNYNAVNMKLTNGAIDAVQSISTSASPTFAGLTLGSLSGLLKATNGLVSAVTLTTTDVPEGSNLYLTNSRVRAALSAGTGITYDQSTGIITATNVSAALSGTSDTNVTISLGGSYSSALLAATSITLGWTGLLSAARGGTGVGSYVLGDMLYSSTTNTLSTLPGNYTTTKKYLTQSGTGVVSSAPTWSTIAASELTGTSLPATIVSSSLTSTGLLTNLTVNRHFYINSNQPGNDQNIFYVDDGQFGTYTGSRFGTTSNDSGYANKQDVLSYTRTGMSNSVNGGPGYSILGLRPPIDRYQNDGAVCPRESTLTVSRNFYVGGVGSSAQSESMDFYNNKYPEYPLGTGINYGIALTKTGTDSVFREFSINFRCPTSANPTTNATNVFRVLPFTNPVQDDPTKMSLARIRFENSNVDIAGCPINYLSTTTLTQNLLSISLTNHQITLTSPNSDLYTGMPVIFNTPTSSYLERPGANVCNTYIGSSGLGIITGTGTISVVAGSPIVSGTSTLFATQQYFTVGAIITFGQYAYTVLSIQSDTSLTLTENVFANGTFNNQKWYFAYPSTHPIYYGRLARGGEYFVIVVDSSTIKFANTYDNAMKGTNIMFTAYGNGAQLSFSYHRCTSVKASSDLVANTNFVLPSNLPSANNVLVTDSSGNTSWTSSLSISALALGAFSGILKASSGVVSGSATTTDLTEGTNLYFTITRSRSAISAGTGIAYDSSTGVISNSVANTTDLAEGSNLYFTSHRARSVISAGTGIAYDSSTGVISNSVVSTADLAEGSNLYYTNTRARTAISAGTGIAYDSSTGIIAVTTTSDIAEGSNLYFTSPRARSAISAGSGIAYDSSTGVISNSVVSTTDLAEGSNLYYTNTRARAAISAGTGIAYDSSTGVIAVTTTTDLAEGSNLYYTNTRARTSISAGTGIAYDSSTGVISNSVVSTTDLAEGSNLFYTNTRARTAISAGTGIYYDSTTGVISTSNVVTSITGTPNQVLASATTGNIILSLPQSIDTTAKPQFSSIGIGSAAVNGYGLNLSVPTASATNYGLYMFNASAYTGSSDVGLWLNNTFTPSTTGASLISSKCTPTFNTSSGVFITKATGFDSSPSFNAGIGSATYTDSYGMSTNPVLTVTSTSALTVGSLRCCYMNPTVTMSGAAHVLTNLYGLYLGTGFTTILNSSSVTNAYGIFINGLIGASTNYGLYISGGFLRNNDNALRIASSFIPALNAADLYAARITPTFTSSAGLTHTGSYGLDITPNFNSSTTGTFTTVYGQNISPIINATGGTAITISALRGLSIRPSVNMSNAAHVLTNLNGIYVDVPSTTLGTGSITNSYGAYINVSSVAATNYGMFITGNFTKSSDLAFRLGSNITPALNALTLYQTRLQGQFVASAGLTHSNVYGIDVNPTFVSTGTGTFTTLHGQNVSPVVNASGVSPILITTLKGINVTPTFNLTNAAHTLGNYYGIYVDSGTVNLGTGSITNAYGGYFKTPSGTNTSALYADTISCGNGGVTVPSSTILYVSPTIPKTTPGTLAAIRIAGGTCSVTQNTTSELAMVFANATLSVSGTGTGTSVASYIGKCNSSVQVGGTITQMADFIAKGTLTYTAGTLGGAYGYYSQQTLVGTTAIPIYAGFYADAPVVSSGSVFYAYGGYFKNPATGTLRSAVYAEDLNVGVTPVATPTLGDLRCVTAYARNYRTTDSMFASVRNNNLFECVKYTVTWSISSATSSVYMQRIGYVVTLNIASFTMNTSTSSACNSATGIVPACPATVKVGCPIIAYNGGYTSCIFSVNASGAMFIQSATAGNITPSNGLNIFPDSTLCQIVQYTMQPL